MYNEKPEINYLSIFFFFAEAIFIIILISIIPNILGTSNITISPTSQPVATIENLRSTLPEVSSDIEDTIERNLYALLLHNSTSGTLVNSATSASVQEDSIRRNNFDTRGVNLVSATIDVPALRQSYSFFYGYPQEGNSNYQTFYTILCPTTTGTYTDFTCRSSSTDNNTKETILSTFLSYFDFDYFSATLDSSNQNRIIISPSVTYNNSESTKNDFIKEVKAAVDSLGIDSSSYEYYVRSAADIDYENQDR